MLQTLKSLHLTFYSATFYQQLITSWKGIGLGFLLVATLLNALNIGMKVPHSFLGENYKELFAEFPDVSLKDGVMSMEAPSPQEFPIFEKTEDGPFKIVFDMSKPPNNKTALKERMEAEKIFVLVSPTHLSIKAPNQEKVETQDFSGIDDTIVTQEEWLKIETILVALVAPSTLIFTIGALFLNHFLTALFGAIFLLLVSQLLKITSDFKGMLRLAAAAKVPLATFSLFVAPHLALQGLIWLGFALFGLLAARKPVGKKDKNL
ncbi:MAG TPA: hypothetical protein DD400_04080 [Rhodospirillaceae bacterium]|nr:hypothetical protein [Rhodospirillaceae bacterium]